MCEADSLVSITCSTRIGILAQCLRAQLRVSVSPVGLVLLALQS